MTRLSSRDRFLGFLLTLNVVFAGCSASAINSPFFGKTDPPRENVLRYVSGSEPETLDPQIPSQQNEARIAMALFEGLTEYDPKTTAPIPALAERWKVNKDWSEVTFHLRREGRFSNGDPITAHDFVYSIRRGLKPSTGSRTASLAFPIKYAQAFNGGGVFVFDPTTKSYLLEREFAENAPQPPLSEQDVASVTDEYPPNAENTTPGFRYSFSSRDACTGQAGSARRRKSPKGRD